MRKLVLLGLAAAIAAGSFAWWHANRATAQANSPFAQIFIHGTPVCVFTAGENILARVGECPDSPGADDGDPGDNEGMFQGQPGMELPPGHPPVDRDMFPDQGRAIPI